MGNTGSNVTSAVRKQTDSSSVPYYKLVDLKGKGELVDLMSAALRTKDYSLVEEKIRRSIPSFLYNGGRGKWIPIEELVLRRNKERPKSKQISESTLGESYSKLKAIDNIDEPEESIHRTIDKSKYRFVCWDLDKRGTVGETMLHLCFLNFGYVQTELAKRLIQNFPNLVNDIYVSDEYYGENVLHMSIVNEDVSMVKLLLNYKTNYHERFFGNFVCPDDQKSSRSDSLNHEYVDVCLNTNYESYLYWGEYPLSFAACLEQEECYRLILARGANPDLQDTNGNMVLHMLYMFNLAYELGASLYIKNRQELTPLTLASKLATTSMFSRILALEREIYWQFGNILISAYPLSQIDTIDQKTGKINKNSVLNLIVYGDKDDHLELLSGVVEDLLCAKWNSFVKFRLLFEVLLPFILQAFFTQFFIFTVYFILTLICFTTQSDSSQSNQNIVMLNSTEPNHADESLRNASSVFETNTGQINFNSSTVHENAWLATLSNKNISADYDLNNLFEITSEPGKSLLNSTSEKTRQEEVQNGHIHRILELLIACCAALYLGGAGRELYFLGRSMFLENLVTVPSRVLFLFSCCLMLFIAFVKTTSYTSTADYSAVLAMLTTPTYFLFFCRGFKKLGSFVVIIYKMITGDLLRFLIIYMVFVMGFSQVFLTYKCHSSENKDSPMSNPAESIMSIFIMSINNFADMYKAFSCTDHEILAKILFVIFMAIVSILLVNMLIAMMGNTYQRISEKNIERLRQWGRIVLLLERGFSPKQRLKYLNLYSQPMADGRRALIVRRQYSEQDKEEIDKITEMKRRHEKAIKRNEARAQE